MTTALDPTSGVEVAVDAVKNATSIGADEAQVAHSYSEMFEVESEGTDVSLVRSTTSDGVSLTVFKGTKKGQSSLTGRAPDAVHAAVAQALSAADSGIADDANKVAVSGDAELHDVGAMQPDREAMIDAVQRHIAYMADEYPLIRQRTTTYRFVNTWRSFANSASVTRQERRSGFAVSAMWSGKDGEKTTSINFGGATSVDPFDAIIEAGTLRAAADDTIRSFDPKPVPATFVGDVIFTPDSLDTLLGPLAGAIGGMALMRGTSPFADARETQIASPCFSLTNRPLSPEFPLAAGFDGFGIPSENRSFIADGVLADFLIGWYTSNKLNLPMTAGVTHFDVAPGEKSIDQIITETERGIVLSRYSGGNPNAALDFSGVAKNSFYVEDGEIKHPISETMVAGNFKDLLMQIRDVSSEVVNFGGESLPYLAASGVTISTK